MINTSRDINVLKSLSLGEGVSTKDSIFLEAYYQLEEQSMWMLSCIDEVYQITHRQKKLSLSLDFREGNYRHRNQYLGKEPLLNAVKIKNKLPKTLIDATPGILKDSVMLSARGIKITAIERNPLLFVMVRQALSLAKLEIDYHFSDAITLLPTLSAEVIYLDPMFPTKKKSAQVKKDMQILHSIVGPDNDSLELFKVAIKKEARVVVKRPNHAKHLGGIAPSFSSRASKKGATRFDIYLP